MAVLRKAGGSVRSRVSLARTSTLLLPVLRQHQPILPHLLQPSWFATSSFRLAKSSNRVYDSVRHPSDLSTYLLLSTSSRRALITLWTTKWCATCRTVSPLLHRLIDHDRVGEAHGGLSYVEIELDSPLIGTLPVEYAISSIPTLLAFSSGEPQRETAVSNVSDLKSEVFLREWLETEAKRGGGRGAGGGRSLFGGFFSW